MSEPIHRGPEPEIIPPGAPLPRRAAVWMSSGGQRVYTARPGPVGLALIAIAVGIVGVIGLVVLLGLAVIGLIAAGLLTAAFVIAGILRKVNQPLR